MAEIILKTVHSEIDLKTADSFSMGLFMRVNGKCNNSHAPCTSLRDFLLLPEPIIPQGSGYKENEEGIWICLEVNSTECVASSDEDGKQNTRVLSLC